MLGGRNRAFYQREHIAKVRQKREFEQRIPAVEEFCTRESGAYVLLALGISRKLEAFLEKRCFICRGENKEYSANSLAQLADMLAFARKASPSIREAEIMRIAWCVSPARDRWELFKASIVLFADGGWEVSWEGLKRAAESLARTYDAPKSAEVFREIFLSGMSSAAKRAHSIGFDGLVRRLERHCELVRSNRLLVKDLPDPSNSTIRNAVLDYTPLSKSNGPSPISIRRK